MKIIPTVFAHNKKEFQLRFAKLLPISKSIQIDFMDGKFVKSRSISLNQIPNLKKFKNNFEAHLMAKNPEKYLSKLKQKGFKKVIFHVETASPEKISSSLELFVAINPETPIEKLIPFLPKVKGILVMGVHPGKEHQKFIPSVYKKISNLKRLNKKIQVDGGVNEKVAKKLAKLKVDFVNIGSFISASENPKESLNKLTKVFSKDSKTIGKDLNIL